jgi:hypothetical protein
VERIRCGDYVWGDTSHPNSGHTTVIDSYPVAPGHYDGPEVAWEFVADRSGPVTFRLEDPEPLAVDHDVFVLAGDGSCRADRALYKGHNSVTFDAWAGEQYYVLIDGYDGDAGMFDAHLACDGDGGPPLESPTDPCEGLRGIWDGDPLEVTATCTVLDDGAAPDSDGAPTVPLEAGSVCLARGVYGLNGAPYWVLGGELDPVSPELPNDLQAHAVAFVGGDGSRAVESDDGVVLWSESLGYPGVDDGDLVTEVRWRAADESLTYLQREVRWGGEVEVLFSARWRCGGER